MAIKKVGRLRGPGIRGREESCSGVGWIIGSEVGGGDPNLSNQFKLPSSLFFLLVVFWVLPLVGISPWTSTVAPTTPAPTDNDLISSLDCSLDIDRGGWWDSGRWIGSRSLKMFSVWSSTVKILVWKLLDNWPWSSTFRVGASLLNPIMEGAAARMSSQFQIKRWGTTDGRWGPRRLCRVEVDFAGTCLGASDLFAMFWYLSTLAFACGLKKQCRHSGNHKTDRKRREKFW